MKTETPCIETPCIAVCEIERSSGLCKGCKRTLDEIARWGRMTADERKRAMAEIGERIIRNPAF